jgi:lysozyme
MNYIDILESQLAIDEGVRDRPYRCSEGYLSLGIGHNLDTKPISKRAIRVIFEDDMADAEKDARILFPTFESLSDQRKAALVNMSFQLGRNRLAGFLKFREAIQQGDFGQAATEALDSRWAKQTPERAQRVAQAIREG